MKFRDQIGSEINLTETPHRIVSVVPSQTELLYDLGLDEEVVGITKFCIHPEKWFRTKTRIGGTKKLNIEKISELRPDLILANKEENDREDIERLQKLFPVWTSDIKNLNGAIQMIDQVGVICSREKEALLITKKITENFRSISESEMIECVYLIWHEPVMTIGADTFINDMLNRAGFKSITDHWGRYPVLTEIELVKLNPPYLLLSSEPFPFKDEHITHYQKMLPQTKILKVDGEMFSWYGSRLTKASGYFSELRLKVENAS